MKSWQIQSPDAAWDDLDALVVEQMEALGDCASAEAPPSPFVDDEAFLAASLAYLDGHSDRERLLAVLAREPWPPAPGDRGEGPAAGSPASPTPDPPPDKEPGQ